MDGETLRFGYDTNGRPLTVTYKGYLYYYVTNIQGDVVAILNSSGEVKVKYTYDAWGNILSTTGSLANTLGKYNPLRYRGYVYDTETGLYYLKSRYYDPAIGRFLNADNYPSTGQGLLGNNMFAYCCNNPANYSDPSGFYMVARDDISAYGGAAILYTAGINVATDYLRSQWDEFSKSVEKSLSKVTIPKKYKSQTEIHHIAAQKAYKAKQAQEILEIVFPGEGVESPYNKVELKTNVHRRVHTNLYYSLTNIYVVKAYYSAAGDMELAQLNVVKALNKISLILVSINS